MRKLLLLFLIALLWPQSIFSQAGAGGTGQAGGSQVITIVSGLVAYQTKGFVASVTNGNSSTDCTVGGGSNTVVCQYTGSAWTAVGGTGTGSVTSFSAGNMSPVFTTSVATPTTTPALSFTLSNAAANTVFGNNTGGSAAPGYQSLVAAQEPATTVNSIVNDTNVTGSIASQALTLGWQGTLAKGRTLGTTVYTDQVNTFGAFLNDFSASTWKIPAAAGFTSSASSTLGIDTTNKNLKVFLNATDLIEAPLASGFVSGHCGQPTSSSGTWTIADTGSACGAGGGSLTASGNSVNQVAVWTSTTNLTGVGTGLTGQGLIANNAAAPTFNSPGIAGRTASTADTILCDSGTAIRDRVASEEYTAVLTVTVPDAGSAGCAANFVTEIINATTASLVTVNRTTSSTFTLYNGVTTQTGLTTFSLNPGEFAALHSRDNTNWIVRITVGSTYSYGTGGGTAQAQTLTVTVGPTPGSLADGQTYCWKPAAANTAAAPTLAVQGLTATTITKLGNTALVANDIVTSAQACVIYNSSGPRFELQNPQVITGTGTVTSIATTSPITGGTITTTGTIACATCVTSAAALTNNAVMIGNGSQASATIAADTTTTHALFATAGAPAFRAIVAGDLPNIPINQVISPTGTIAAIALGNRPLPFTCAVTTDSQDCTAVDEASAATGGTLTNGLANQAAFEASTASGSTATPAEINQGSVTGATGPPALQIESTWNNASLVGEGLLFNVTNTSSAAASKLLDLRVGNTAEITGDKSGNLVALTSLQTTATAPACTAGTAGAICLTEGTLGTNVSGSTLIDADNTAHEILALTNGATTNPGMLVRRQPSPIHSTGNTASISTATLCAAAAGACNVAGQYHVHVDFIQTGTACTVVTAGGVTFTLSYTDTNATAHSHVIVLMGEGAAATTPAMNQNFFFQTSLANAFASGDINISTNGTVIQYATTYTACTTGTGTYQLDAAVTRLQ
jgi:hypothetical protein